MGIFSGLFRSRDKPQNRTTGSAYSFFFGGSSAGKRVNERSAMQMTAVYSCVRILSEAMLIAQQEMQSKDLTITRQQRELDERRPLALLGEAFVSTDGTMSVTQAARHFQTIDRRMTRDMVYGLLRGAGYVETHGNASTKKAIKPGYLVQRQHIRDDRKLGKPYARFTTKGVNWFIRRFIYGDSQPALEGVD